MLLCFRKPAQVTQTDILMLIPEHVLVFVEDGVQVGGSCVIKGGSYFDKVSHAFAMLDTPQTNCRGYNVIFGIFPCG